MNHLTHTPLAELAKTTHTVRRVAEDEAAALERFASKCFVDTYGATSSERDVAAYVSQHLNLTAITAVLNDPASTPLVVESNGEWIGYAHLRTAPIPLHVPPIGAKQPVELVRFYVAREHHGLGVAGALFNEALRTISEQGSDTLWLVVWQENARAIAFYKRQGFRFVGTAHFQMGEELQDDFIMLRTLSDPVSRQQRSL